MEMTLICTRNANPENIGPRLQIMKLRTSDETVITPAPNEAKML